MSDTIIVCTRGPHMENNRPDFISPEQLCRMIKHRWNRDINVRSIYRAIHEGHIKAENHAGPFSKRPLYLIPASKAAEIVELYKPSVTYTQQELPYQKEGE